MLSTPIDFSTEIHSTKTFLRKNIHERPISTPDERYNTKLPHTRFVFGYKKDNRIIACIYAINDVISGEDFLQRGHLIRAQTAVERMLRLSTIAVAEEFRGQGMARELITHAHALASDRGMYCSVAICSDDPGTVTFYQRLGYTTHPVDMAIIVHLPEESIGYHARNGYRYCTKTLNDSIKITIDLFR